MTTGTPLVSEFNKKVYMKYKERYAMNADGYVINFRAFWEDWCKYYILLTDDHQPTKLGYGKMGNKMHYMQCISVEMCHGKLEKLWKDASRKYHPDKVERCVDDTADDIDKKIVKATSTIQLVNQARDFFTEFFDFHNIPPINTSYNCLYRVYKLHQRECEKPIFDSYSKSSWNLLIDHANKQRECSAKDDELETVNNKLRDVKVHEELLQQQIDAHNTETAEVQQRIQTMMGEFAGLRDNVNILTEELIRVTGLLDERNAENIQEVLAVTQEFERMKRINSSNEVLMKLIQSNIEEFNYANARLPTNASTRVINIKRARNDTGFAMRSCRRKY
jgi:hypothetical protein